MGKSGAVGVKFDKQLLNSLKEDPDSCVELIKSRQHIALHPLQLNDFKDSLKSQLNEGIAKYNRKLQGIMMGYQNLKLPSDLGTIANDMCFIHLDIEAEFFVFKPEIGKELKGVVSRFTKDHVGCLVYNAFNVSLPQPENSGASWLGNHVQVGYEVMFRITHMNLEARLPFLKGELISILTETDSGISTCEESSGKKKKSNKKIKFTEETDEKISFDQEESPKKKKKKKHTLHSQVDDLVQSLVGTEAVTKKHKKSKKAENLSQEDLNMSGLSYLDQSESKMDEPEVKKSKKRRHSVSFQEPPADNLDELSEKRNHKRKRKHSISQLDVFD